MPEVRFSEHDQRVLRALLAAEPVPGRPLPHPDVLANILELVPCDSLGAVHADLHGRISSQVELIPAGGRQGTLVTTLPTQRPRTEHGGPFYLGFMHWREHPARAEHCGNIGGPGDGLAIGYRNGCDDIVQYFFHRESGLFNRRDLAILEMLGPVLQRLVRERPTPRLPADITLTERRVLTHVAAGRSNAQIAETLCISVGTVRKHLEHAYRKLGVTSRMAAIARLRGSDQPGLDLQERVDRFA
jgi:DNA-binding CsgD family transcriptional regulator